MSREFIPMYRVLKDGGIAGYLFNKPKGKDKGEAKRLKLTFEHIRSEADLTPNDRKLVLAILPELGRAMAFQEGVANATIQGKVFHLVNTTHYEGDAYIVMIDFVDQSEQSYTLLDYRLSFNTKENVNDNASEDGNVKGTSDAGGEVADPS